jgi:alpha-N-arabinofuranosidase
MQPATFTVDPAFRVGAVDRRLFGSFVEHMGRSVYTGIYQPDHPSADRNGFRGDVLDLVRELGPTIVRYPGGNFVSGYRWEDGIGPVESRPRRLDLAWKKVESNEVGVDEFMTWCSAAGLEPMMAVNLGTRGVQEAADLVEYCNYPEGTALSDLRRSNGAKEPHDIRVWCLGNELDGPWQVGHKTPHEYARLAAESARAMRMVDRGIELVACGSSNTRMPTFAAWEAAVLEHCYELVDYISLHNYYEPFDDDMATFLASGVDLDGAIEAIIATADHVGAKLRSRKRLRLSVDEWNVWYQRYFRGQDALSWSDDPRIIEDVYDVHDAVVVGGLLISLLRHADRVGIACQAQLVNVIAPIMTEPGGPAWRQTIFHPFAQAARLARGDVLRVEPKVATHPTRYGDVTLIDVTATYDDASGDLTLLAVNRGTTEPVEITADVRSLGGYRLDVATTLHCDDPTTKNTAAAPDAVVPTRLQHISLDGGMLRGILAPISWNVLRLTPDRADAQPANPKEQDR